MRTLLMAGLVAGAAGLASGSDTIRNYDLAGKPAWTVVLPHELAEVSGLAFTADGRLYAHGDEVGVVHRLDPRSGRILSSFSLAPTGREPDLGKKGGKGGTGRELVGDFEGIAIAGSRFFLVTSNGVLLEFAEGANGARVPYTAHVTRLGSICELEGAEHDPSGGDLLLLCKGPRGNGLGTDVRIYAWSLAQRRLTPRPSLTVRYSDLARVTRRREFNGSGLAVRSGGRSIVLVAGPQRAFAEVSRDGRVLNGGVFPPGVQRQPEAVAFAPDGALLVSSEAAGRRATLSGYLPVRR
jgi:hypothetical protein